MHRQNHVLTTSSQLGQILQASRKAKKWSQARLASKLGLSQSRVSHLELHPEELSFAQLMNWCAVLGLELSVDLVQWPARGVVDNPLSWRHAALVRP